MQTDEGGKKTVSERIGSEIGTVILWAVWIYVAWSAFDFVTSVQDSSRDTKIIVATLAIACMLIHRVGNKITELQNVLLPVMRDDR